MTKELFFKQYYHSAVKAERETGVPALAVLAQAALESGWGEKAPNNMFFGIKAGPSWKGKRQLITTREVHSKRDIKYPEILSIIARSDGKYDYRVKDWFRAYDTAGESFADHGRFLQENPRYKKAFETTDPVKFVEAVAAAGYATDPEYAKTLKSIIASLQKMVPGS
ncbi:glycoside hydrolase family 73 protein [Chitinophaga tropicalis]|uniref:Peptidoglycan hydrolase n=1 Tax=Chitinophaga tropicalis TaxID=2683588 RepID=A0A7K1UAU9_9BACT|nr:glucosaminidase domain-containing protein [Chitinophaga tropicalis]MVT11390.1 peptidoglycan hydrolase [Chitinophaga tropicalis]